jgi:acylphosphatase
MTLIARHLMIVGRVQGVFYRNWAVQTARGLGVAGWVRNRIDGSVEVWAEGSVVAVGEFVRLAHDGPGGAEVLRIEVGEGNPEGMSEFVRVSTK